MIRHCGRRMLARMLLPILLCPVLLSVEVPTAAAQLDSLMRNNTQNVVRATREQIRRAIVPQLVVRRGATGPVNAAAASPDWRYIATAVGDNTVRLWDLRTGAQVATLRPGAAPVRQVLVAADGRSVVTIDNAGTVLLSSTVEGEAARPLAAPGQTPVTAAALSNDGRLLILGQSDGSVAIWDMAAQRPLQRLSGTAGTVTAVDAAAGPGGTATVAATFGNGSAATWSLASGTVAAAPQANWRTGAPASAVRVAEDGTVVVGTQGGDIEVWRPGQAQPQTRWRAHSGTVTSLSGTAGGAIVSGGGDGAVRSWRLPQGNAGRSFAESGQRVSAVLLRPDGSRALAAGAEGAVRIFDTGSGRELARLISTDNGWIVVDSAGRFDGMEQTFQDVIWNAGGTAVAVDNFSADYFEPGLLVKHLDPQQQQQMLTPAARPVDQGIHLPPRVAVETVTPAPYAAGRPLEVKVTATDQGGGEINGIRLFHNGKRIGDEAIVDRAQTSPGGALTLAVTYRVTPTAGSNRFLAVALGWGNLESDPQRLSVNVQAAAAQATLRLTSVGIDSYHNSRLNLNYAVADANGIAGLFGERARGLFAAADSAILVNNQASRAGLLARLSALQQASAPDTVVLFLSGHGVAQGSNWYFVPYDLDHPEDARNLQSGGISGEQLSELLVASPAQRILLIIDACQSGAVVSGFNNFQQRRALRGLERETGVHVLAATRADQQAPEYPELRHGLFTHTLLNAFQVNRSGRFNADTEPSDGQLTVTELRRYVERNVPMLARVLEERRGQASGVRGDDLAHRAAVTPMGLALGEDIILTRR